MFWALIKPNSKRWVEYIGIRKLDCPSVTILVKYINFHLFILLVNKTNLCFIFYFQQIILGVRWSFLRLCDPYSDSIGLHKERPVTININELEWIMLAHLTCDLVNGTINSDKARKLIICLAPCSCCHIQHFNGFPQSKPSPQKALCHSLQITTNSISVWIQAAFFVLFCFHGYIRLCNGISHPKHQATFCIKQNKCRQMFKYSCVKHLQKMLQFQSGKNLNTMYELSIFKKESTQKRKN